MARPKKEDLEKKAESLKKDRTDTYRWWEQESGKKLIMLEQAFRIDATDEEACSFADITPDQLYYYQREINPTFQVEKALWKKQPTLQARQEVVNGIKGNPELALKYLERKVKDEFSLRQEVTGKDGESIELSWSDED